MELLIKYYGGFVIPRKAFVDANGHKTVEVYLKTVKIIKFIIFYKYTYII